jgi:hypothetical protein
MGLLVIASTLALSMGLGLAGAYGLLSIVFFFMERSIAQQGARNDRVAGWLPGRERLRSDLLTH